ANAKGGAVSVTLGLTGFVFNVMLIVRAPLQLFQAIQTSILPHLAGLEARESADEFRRAICVTVLARGRARIASAAWLTSAALFVIFVAAPTIHSEVTRVEVGYFGATAVLTL